MNTNKTAHHPGVEADVTVRLVLVPLSGVNFDHVKLSVLPVPVENPLYARPATPLHVPPARLGGAHPHLCHPRSVDIRAIDPRSRRRALNLPRPAAQVKSRGNGTTCSAPRPQLHLSFLPASTLLLSPPPRASAVDLRLAAEGDGDGPCA